MPCNLGVHHGVKSFGEDVERMVEDGPCGPVYLALEECLGEHDRDWRCCQQQVKALAACSKRARNNCKTAPKDSGGSSRNSNGGSGGGGGGAAAEAEAAAATITPQAR